MASHPPRRTMRLHHTFIVLCLSAAVCACTARQDKRGDTEPAPQPGAAKVADPMASFARMTPGEWRMTAPTGTSMVDTWRWGPGKHSMRVMTDGSGAAGNPWREVQVFYWRPERKQVCMLGLSPFARGVSEGTIKFEGEAADAVFDLYQTGVRRKMGLRWTFDGPDKYHEILSEATGAGGLEPLAEWDYIRSTTPATRPPAAEEEPGPSERLKVLEPFLGHTWEAEGAWGAGEARRIRTTFEWIPYAEGIYVCVMASPKDGEGAHLLDAYIYQHTGTGALRCLALSNSGEEGGVYEGDLTVLDGGAVLFDLKGYEDDRVVAYGVRWDFEKDGALHNRVWAVEGAARTLMLDVRHRKLEPKKGSPARSGAGVSRARSSSPALVRRLGA